MDIATTDPEPRAWPGSIAPPAGAPAQAEWLDNLLLMLEVVLPTIAKGVIIRRPGVLALAEKLDLDRRAIRRMQQLRARYGEAPLRVRMPDKPRVLILAPQDVHRVLENTPEPFSPASSEKRAALTHFQPHGALVSRGSERTARRRLNEAALQSGSPVHALAQQFAQVAHEEAHRLLLHVRLAGGLDWPAFSAAWTRVVQRVVLGGCARDDRLVATLMTRLRRRANWAWFAPQRPDLRAQLLQRIHHYLRTSGPQESLAGFLATLNGDEPEQQVPQWLFAFDPAGMATLRALALLATHPAEIAQARAEAQARDLHSPLLRAAVLESVRLWPTTPLLLRELASDTDGLGGPLRAGTGVLIYTPFFHRDGERLAHADDFHPQHWLAPRSTQDWPLVPFSSGPAACPARHLVLQVASSFLGELLRAGRWRLEHPARLRRGGPLPATLSHAGLRFGFRG